MKRIITLVLVLGLFGKIWAQNEECTCCKTPFDQFNFWVGDWIVYDTLGVEIGRNTIQYKQDNCLMQENWVSTGSTGTSYNYYNKADSTWNQVWVDNFANNLVLKGGLQGNAMVMRSEKQPGVKMKWYVNKITWTPQLDGSVIQQWDIENLDNKVVATIFYGVYRKTE